jgi:hypothetical protein
MSDKSLDLLTGTIDLCVFLAAAIFLIMMVLRTW